MDETIPKPADVPAEPPGDVVTDAPTNDDDHAALIRESALAYVQTGAPLGRARALYADGKLDRAAWREQAELGWLGLMAPEAHGGSDLGLAELAVLLEELGRGGVPEPLVMASLLTGRVAARTAGPDAAALGAEVASGGVIPLAWQERAGELSVSHAAARAERSARGWTISGEKRFVTAAAAAGGFVVAARAADGLGLFRIAREARGLAIENARGADGGSVGRLLLDAVAADAVVAEPGLGEAIVDAALDEGRIALSAQMLGLMQALFGRTLDYLRTRKQFGRAIGSFQALQHRAVDLHVAIELSRAALRRAVRAFALGDDVEARAMAASACKARASDACLTVAREAIQLHGAIAYTDEHDIGIFVRQSLLLSAALGNAPSHRRRYGLLTARHLAA